MLKRRGWIAIPDVERRGALGDLGEPYRVYLTKKAAEKAAAKLRNPINNRPEVVEVELPELVEVP